jgi:zinc protease
MSQATTFEAALPSSQNITRTELDNGIVVLVYEKPNVDSVVISGSIPAGSLYSLGQQTGLASMAAAALMRGTTHRDFEQLHTELEVLGADMDVDAGRFKAGFGGKALAEDLPTLITLLADVLRYPAFDPNRIDLLRGELLTSINYAMQDTRYRARKAFTQQLYPSSHPYHDGVTGTLETIESFTPDDLRTFHQQYYGPKGSALVIVGNIKAADAVDIVRDQLGDWTNPDQPGNPSTPTPPTVSGLQRVDTLIPGKTQADVVLGFAGPSRYAQNYQAVTLVNSVLGQFGMMGRIGDVVREEKGYAYYSYSSVEGGHGPGAWSAAAGVAPHNVEETVTDIVNEFRRITEEPVSDEDLENVQSYYTGNLPLQLESSEGVANTILRLESYGLGLDYLLSYRDTINSLTADDLLNAAQAYINVDNVTISVAGPATK